MKTHSHSQSGNMLIYILGAIFLLGFLIVIIKGNFQEGTGIDPEKVALAVGEVQKQASELERAVAYLQQNGVSESDIRFAHPDGEAAYGDINTTPQNQVFSLQGGGAEYRLPPAAFVPANQKWEFFAFTHVPDMGTDTPAERKAELMAVVPNVNRAFCERVNNANNLVIDLDQFTDPTAQGCIWTTAARFTAGLYGLGVGVNTLDSTKISRNPAREACVRCQTGGGYHYYRVLMAR